MISAWRQELYFVLLRMRVHSLYVCTLLFLIPLCGLWWWCMYVPMQHATHENQRAVITLENSAVSVKNIEHDIVVLKNSIAQLKNSYQSCIAKAADEKTVAQSLHFLMHSAQQIGLTITHCKSCGKRDKSWCSAYDINVELLGSFDQIVSFFNTLKEKYSFITCKNFEIAHKDKESFSLRALFSAMTIDLKQKTLQLNS
jgi:Tfp pilus assembly protein PilO